MSSEWSVKKLGDLVTFLSGGTPSKSNKDYWDGEIPWISASSMQSTRYNDSDLRVTSLGSTNGTRSVPAGTVLLLVRGGALHNKIPVGITTREVTFNQDVKALVPKSEDITPYYLLAWLISSRDLLLGKVENTGIGAGKLDTKILQDLDVPLPPKAELLRLELFSKALDDKIILNQNINHTLEQMAQALFKSWFVDFEPVKAKMAVLEAGGSQEDATLAAMTAISGKDANALAVFEREQPVQYAELKATAELFPSAMQESELGEIPEGWALGSLSDIATFANGKVDVSSLTLDTYVSTENMLENRAGISRASSLPSVNSVPDFRRGHVLISNIRPYFKKIWLARFEGGRSADVLAFEARDSVTVEYIYNLLYQESFFDFMMLTSKGVKMPRGDKKAIMGWQCICPEKKISKAFSTAVGKYYSFIESNNAQNKTLTQLRDTLLPKLLSGEITLPEAEQTVSEAENV
ncbi:restriction endonuclease subunit S [Cronobacter sakazakii]|uniref:restriction endonuclease subunit S n=1 Tax=Cronobacter sakazakii TaxID=28141 RepID=UPI000BEAD579|nr:restriction endonuclease subunit S [Cronobacter sakazakii]EJJ0545482.1 restriction endonuclease subunit S [Cronobacter sakazakii]ELY6081180.1 restriction endonuclease subunit S [Cronobacter sakazakii]MDT3574934.1 restriction endonuclease subunit S [Cronobacter sakazakii]NCH18045.1 restriction endonuclease subunit S [Cronobacter sakazakii]PQV75942.1 restriction endonuclease subunit S [Cronobacter sakazakii]